MGLTTGRLTMETVFVLVWLWLDPQVSMRDAEGPPHHLTRAACEAEASYRHPPPLVHGEAPQGHLCVVKQAKR
jgi:hypothetical protein